MSLKARMAHGSIKRPVKRAVKKPIRKPAPCGVIEIPARLVLEREGDGVRVHVYRTDREHPNSLAYTFHVTQDKLESDERCVILYDAIRAPLAEVLGLY